MIRFLPEYAPAALPDGKLLSYVEASEEAFRVFFWRDAAVQPVVGLEAYAAFLYIPDEQVRTFRTLCTCFALILLRGDSPGARFSLRDWASPRSPGSTGTLTVTSDVRSHDSACILDSI